MPPLKRYLKMFLLFLGMDVVLACFECGRRYTEIKQLLRVRQLGLALYGICHCGAEFAVNRIWRVTPALDLTGEQGEIWQKQTDIKLLR